MRDGPLHSCLYTGRVLHRRSHPVEHAFAFPLYLVYLDLSELDSVFEGRWLWSTRRPAFARFDRRDHLGDPDVPLDAAIRDLVAERLGRRPAGPVRVLTHLRYAGYVFNPVSFHYCFEPSGRRLDAVVAEVTNTPWNERHVYVLDAASAGAGDEEADERGSKGLCTWSDKTFHVSPFMPMDMRYRWSLSTPGERLSARIESFDSAGRPVFDASLRLDRRPIAARPLARALVAHPLVTLQTSAAIYWQALRLYARRAPFHPHPEAAP